MDNALGLFCCREVKPRDTVVNRLKRYAEGDTSQDTSQQASETGSVQDTTDAESQMSDLAAWGEDPEVQDKVRCVAVGFL